MTCRNGHDMTDPANVLHRTDGRTYCRQCNREQCSKRRRVGSEQMLVALPNGKRLDATRFWARVPIGGDDECWLWMGRTSKDGYAHYANHGPAYRVTYMLLVGAIPDGLELDHLCCVPLCVNPAHLEPVTRAENMRRRSLRTTHCKRGHAFTAANTMVSARQRTCLTCRNERRRAVAVIHAAREDQSTESAAVERELVTA